MSPQARKAAPIEVPRSAWKVVVWMTVDDPAVFWAFVKRAGFNGSSLARSVGCTPAMISYLGNQKRTCKPDLAERISEALGVPRELLFTRSSSRTALETRTVAGQKRAA